MCREISNPGAPASPPIQPKKLLFSHRARRTDPVIIQLPKDRTNLFFLHLNCSSDSNTLYSLSCCSLPRNLFPNSETTCRNECRFIYRFAQGAPINSTTSPKHEQHIYSRYLPRKHKCLFGEPKNLIPTVTISSEDSTASAVIPFTTSLASSITQTGMPFRRTETLRWMRFQVKDTLGLSSNFLKNSLQISHKYQFFRSLWLIGEVTTIVLGLPKFFCPLANQNNSWKVFSWHLLNPLTEKQNDTLKALSP